MANAEKKCFLGVPNDNDNNNINIGQGFTYNWNRNGTDTWIEYANDPDNGTVRTLPANVDYAPAGSFFRFDRLSIERELDHAHQRSMAF